VTINDIPAEALAAAREGHMLEADPVGGISTARRWTCKTCGDAVLERGGVTYGGATTRTCTESQAHWARVGGPDGDD
jgi:hypothetical protein